MTRTASSLDRTAHDIEPLEGRMLLSGDWGFSAPANLVATADFNGDHKADLVTVSRAGGGWSPKTSVIVQIGRGNGLFIASAARLINGAPSAVVTGDFNGDKNADIGVLSTVNGKSSIQVLPGNGAGGFGAPVKMDLGTMPTANIAAGDINADGYADLVAWDATNVWVSLNDGLGNLPAATQQDNPFGIATPVGLGDFYGDGRYELIGVNGSEVLINMATAATGQFMSTQPTKLGSDLYLGDKRVLMADVNGDGRQDLIAMGDGSVYVALQVVDPLVAAAFAPWVQSTGPISPSRELVADVNGDGKADLFQSGFNFGLVSIGTATLISTGDGTFHKLWF